MRLLLHLLTLIRALAADRARLATETLLLRQQILVLMRSVKRVRLDDGDRAFWVAVHRCLRDWKEHLVIVKPETVLRWHREAFRRFGGARSRSKPGRPPVGDDVVALIRGLASENPLWGAPRIASELARLGHVVADSTVAKYMLPRSRRPPSQTWRTFLRNHLGVSAACDFFTVPTLTFKVLFALVVLSHDRRRILHVNVTRHPTAAWVAQQLTEAFPGDEKVPRYLHRDRDAVYGHEVRKRIAAIGMEELVSAKQCPWQNPFVERVIGSIRRECTDHILGLGEGHLRRVLREYADYYNRARCHLSLERNAPEPRAVEDGRGAVRAVPHLGGLHHRYTRAA
ncbi:MAG: integrase core domain-containing protein [Planctomycetaceae bacterium]